MIVLLLIITTVLERVFAHWNISYPEAFKYIYDNGTTAFPFKGNARHRGRHSVSKETPR